jgi:uncharacterized Ntn-hydrolase superfamily protein
VVREGGGYGGGSDQLVDLRVDDDERPIPQLRRLLDVHDLLFGPVDPDAALPLTGQLADEVRDRLVLAGFPPGDDSPAAIDTALAGWAGQENLEERMLPGRIDPQVLELLRVSGPPRR